MENNYLFNVRKCGNKKINKKLGRINCGIKTMEDELNLVPAGEDIELECFNVNEDSAHYFVVKTGEKLIGQINNNLDIKNNYDELKLYSDLNREYLNG